MTIEEKAKAYDDAIEKLRGLLEGIHEEKCDIMEEDIIKIFPVLKESEDDRIRKEIINYFEHYPNIIVKRERRNDWIAWLEHLKDRIELSEDDIKRLNKITDYLSFKGYYEDSDWLKSLISQLRV